MAAVAAPLAVIFALGGGAHSEDPHAKAVAAAEDATPCCHLQLTAAAPTASSWSGPAAQINGPAAEAAPASRASRWHVAARNAPQVLIADVAPERGLQVK